MILDERYKNFIAKLHVFPKFEHYLNGCIHINVYNPIILYMSCLFDYCVHGCFLYEVTERLW